jgi:glycosyltransferase involved in cell wall biosynthesis
MTQTNLLDKRQLVSVVIPCYKQAAFLKEAIESVFHQTYPHYEILVIDDGSPDDVAEVTKQFPQVRLIKQPNQGAAVARNNGLQQSKGSFLVFLDADDRLLPNALMDGVNYLVSHPEVAFVSGMVQLINAEGDYVKTPKQAIIEKNHFQVLLRSNYIWTPGVIMYRRTVFDKCSGFDHLAGGSADYEINIRIARNHPVGCLGKITLEYRQHGSNMTENLAYMLKSGVSVRRAQYPFIKHDAGLVKNWKAGIQIVQDDVGRRLLYQLVKRIRTGESKMKIIQDILSIFKYYPIGPLKFLKAILKKKLKPSKAL